MHLTTLLDPSTRVIDVGAPDPGVARQLAEGGCARYLGLVPTARLATVREAAGVLAHRFHPLDDPMQVMRCSTDVLLLRQPFQRYLWALQDLDHVRYVAVPAGSPRRSHGGVRALGRAAGKMTSRGRYTLGEDEFDVLELTGRSPRVPRHYLSPVWGVEGLVRRLTEADVRYVVLRWFEDLPAIAPGEDLDVLVADADVESFRQLLAQEPGTIPVDLYSETGMHGTDYRGMAYYPPALATQILQRAVAHTSGCRVPAPQDHLLSLAYHAVYHKGLRSGLPPVLGADGCPDPEHDYVGALHRLARDLGTDLVPTLADADAYLARAGWRPPPDTLRRLAPSNAWIDQRVAAAPPTVCADPPEPTVFMVRQRALETVGLDAVLGVLTALGFEVLRVQDLEETARRRCAQLTRGGNWGRGPFPCSGGDPATVVVALHYGPWLPEAELRAQYPHLTNKDVLNAKLRVRDLVRARVPAGEQFNPLHSSDNESEAWEYAAVALPEEVANLRAQVARLRSAYRTDVPVVRELSRGRRSKVEVVRTDHGPVVRKTYPAAHHRFMARELHGLRVLAGRVAAVPELLDVGPGWFTCPYYDTTLKLGDSPGGRLVPLTVVHRMIDALRQVHAQGLDLVDAKPQNFLLDPVHGLKLVDFEFLHEYGEDRPPFSRMYAFAGVPEGFAGDVPVGDLSYESTWLPYTGLSLEVLLDSPRVVQHLHRAVFRVRRALTGPTGPVRGAARRGRQRLRTLRRHAAGRYGRWARRRAILAFEEAA